MSSNHFRWFVLYTNVLLNEYNFFLNTIIPFLKKLNKNSIDNVEVDIICVGRRKHAKEFIENRIIKIRPKKPYYEEKIISEEKSIENLFVYLKKPYHGIMVSSHSNGVVIGTGKNPDVEVIDFINLCKKYTQDDKKKVSLFIGDSCYMGSIECLYQISTFSDYILATPSYHDGKYSFLQCPDLFKKHNDYLIWLSRLPNWYLNVSENYAHNLDYQIQWTIFSCEEINKLGNYLMKSKIYKEFIFSRSSVIYWDDPDLHNFSLVIENTIKKKPKIKNELDKVLFLYLKSFVYYMTNEKCKCKVKICPMSIHKGLPPDSKNILNCKLEYNKKVHC